MNDLHTMAAFKALDEGQLQPVDKGDVVTPEDRIRAEARHLSEEMFSWEDDHLERDIAYGAAFAAILETEKRIVHWLRGQHQLEVWRSETCPDDMFTEHCFNAEALKSAADAIEAGDHIQDNSNG